MQKLKLLLISTGFFWLFTWTTFGSILGAKINAVTSNDPHSPWLFEAQKKLLTTTHAHMNTMALTLIALALCINLIQHLIPKTLITIVVVMHLIAIPLFGLSLLCEAFYPPTPGHISFTFIGTALGAILYIVSLGAWASFFMAAYKRLS